MRKPAYLARRKSIYYFRARVPTELIEAYGRSMVFVSLGTGDLNVAKARLSEQVAAFHRELARLRKLEPKVGGGLTGTVLHLTDADIERLCQRFRAERLAADERDRVSGLSAHAHQLDLDVLVDGVALLRQNYARGNLQDAYGGLDAFLRSANLYVPRGTPSYEQLARRFQYAELEVYDVVLKRRKGLPIELPLAPADALSFDDVFRAWKKRKASRPAKTVRAFEQAFEELNMHSSATGADSMTKGDAVAFRDRLLAGNTCSRRTIAKHLSFLRAAFEVSKKDGCLDANPFDGVDVELDEMEVKTRSRLPLSIEELRTIFNGPVYQPGFVPRKSLGSSQFWLPLLSLFLGARLEEMAQLHAEDVRLDPEHGSYLVIHAEGERKVKTASSVRQVPLHPELVRMGFLEYVERIKKGRLFPTLKPDKYGKLGTTFSTWFGRYLDSLGITNSQKVFHSLRHSFVALCKQRSAVIPPEVREAIVGHTPTNEIAARYGDVLYPLEPQVAAMRQVAYRGLDLSHLRTATDRETAGATQVLGIDA